MFLRCRKCRWLLCLAVIGCTPNEVVVRTTLDPTHENLMHIGVSYARYQSDFGRPPTRLDHLQPFLKEFGVPEQIVRSPRDGEPIVICWGVDRSVPPSWAKSTPVLAYEKLGSEGNRYVLTTLGSVSLMNDVEFRQASFPPGHRPPF